MVTKKTKVEKHELVPSHEKLSDAEKQTLFSELGIHFRELPKIHKDDSAISDMDLKAGDVVKIVRKSTTAKITTFYRGVTDA